jgi:Fe-S-cluster containining protein
VLDSAVREVRHRYVDPLAQVWLDAAARIGLRVVRSPDAYASTDGGGTMVIGDDASLDADDSLAQMIFHELCHSLVQGEGSFARADWGMDNIGDGDVWREYACLRLQAHLAARHGLRGLFAPTTDWRAFWDALPADPLADRSDPTVAAAIRGLHRADLPPWAPALGDALAATARIAAAVPRRSVDVGALPSLWSTVAPPPAPHPIGLPAHATPEVGGCASCAWRYEGGPGKKAERCRQAAGLKIDRAWPACERFEPAASLDCLTCGACCREAYGAVEVGARDPIRKKRPEFVVQRGQFLEVKRSGDRCAALEGGEIVPALASGPPDTSGAGPAPAHDGAMTTTRYRCTIYDDRPRTCREFTLGSEHCLTARQRVGLTL